MSTLSWGHPAADQSRRVVPQRRLVLVIVAFHPSVREVERLASCLKALASWIGVVVVANDHQFGEPVDRLSPIADLFLRSSDNLGYGRAVNLAVATLQSSGHLPPLIGALNTDLGWSSGSIESLGEWLEAHPEVVLAVPKIEDPSGREQALCKQDPTLLALLSRRFWPQWLKPAWLRRYDADYVMVDSDLNGVFDVPYLSGCCMLIRSRAFLEVGGFDPRFFLYLEDADLTRMMRARGRCVHLPVASIQHNWGRGNHHSWWLTLVNFQSAWLYFRKWGFRWL